MNQKEHIDVTGVELIKEGTNSNGPWHLYKVAAGGKKYSTFLEGLQIGQEYDVLVVNKPFKGSKDGKMHDGWTITGFDNVVYEAKHEVPTLAPAAKQGGTAANDRLIAPPGIENEILHLLKENTKTLEAIKVYLTGEPK